MKTSSTAFLAVMAAASTPAAWAATLRSDTAKKQSSKEVSPSTRPGPGRRLKGKGGKDGLATYEDYEWFVGDYTVKDPDTTINLAEGDRYELPSFKGTRLEVKNVLAEDGSPSLIFEADFYYEWTNTLGGQMNAREIFDGVASYNLDFVNQVTLYSDHVELFLNGEWTRIDNHIVSEVGHFTCSKRAGFPSGNSIICDGYGNDLYIPVDGSSAGEPVHFESMSSAVWTDITGEDEE